MRINGTWRIIIWNIKIYTPCVQNPAFGLLQISQKLEKWQCLDNLPTRRHHQFFLSPSFMAVSLLFLEFWQFLFLVVLTRNLETENTPAWFLSNVWRLERVKDTTFLMCFMKFFYLMLQNAVFTVFKLLRENLHGGGNTPTSRLRFKVHLN